MSKKQAMVEARVICICGSGTIGEPESGDSTIIVAGHRAFAEFNIGDTIRIIKLRNSKHEGRDHSKVSSDSVEQGAECADDPDTCDCDEHESERSTPDADFDALAVVRQRCFGEFGTRDDDGIDRGGVGLTCEECDESSGTDHIVVHKPGCTIDRALTALAALESRGDTDLPTEIATAITNAIGQFVNARIKPPDYDMFGDIGRAQEARNEDVTDAFCALHGNIQHAVEKVLAARRTP